MRGSTRICNQSLFRPSSALPGGLGKEPGNGTVQSQMNFRRISWNGLFSPDLLHMEEKPSGVSAWQMSAGGATGWWVCTSLYLEINRWEEKDRICYRTSTVDRICDEEIQRMTTWISPMIRGFGNAKYDPVYLHLCPENGCQSFWAGKVSSLQQRAPYQWKKREH